MSNPLSFRRNTPIWRHHPQAVKSRTLSQTSASDASISISSLSQVWVDSLRRTEKHSMSIVNNQNFGGGKQVLGTDDEVSQYCSVTGKLHIPSVVMVSRP